MECIFKLVQNSKALKLSQRERTNWIEREKQHKTSNFLMRWRDDEQIMSRRHEKRLRFCFSTIAIFSLNESLANRNNFIVEKRA